MYEFRIKTAIPSKKNNYRAGVTKYGRSYLYKDSKSNVLETVITNELWSQFKNKQTIESECFVRLVFAKRRNDIINLAETVLDSLQSAKILKNDKLVSELFLQWDKNAELRIDDTCLIQIKLCDV